MKLFLIFLTFISINSVRAQSSELDIEHLQEINTKPIRIFLSALWCSPCMGKYKEIVTKLSADTTYSNYVVFDPLGYSFSKLEKISPVYFDSSRTFFLPYNYYKHSKFLTLNLSEKAMKRFQNYLTKNYKLKAKDEELWFGSFLIVDNNKAEIRHF